MRKPSSNESRAAGSKIMAFKQANRLFESHVRTINRDGYWGNVRSIIIIK